MNGWFVLFGLFQGAVIVLLGVTVGILAARALVEWLKREPMPGGEDE